MCFFFGFCSFFGVFKMRSGGVGCSSAEVPGARSPCGGIGRRSPWSIVVASFGGKQIKHRNGLSLPDTSQTMVLYRSGTLINKSPENETENKHWTHNPLNFERCWVPRCSIMMVRCPLLYILTKFHVFADFCEQRRHNEQSLHPCVIILGYPWAIPP